MTGRILGTLAFVMLGTLAGGAAAAAGGATVTVVGPAGTATVAAAAVFGGDDPLVPVRPVAEALGARVSWDGATRTATVTRGDRRLVLPIGRNSVIADGRAVTLPVPPILVGGRTVVLLSFLAAALDARVTRDALQPPSFTVRSPGAAGGALASGAGAGRPGAIASGAAPAATAAAAPAGAPAAPARPVVLGYAAVDYPGDRSWEPAVRDRRGELDLVAYFGLRLAADGSLYDPTGGGPEELLAAARRQGLPVLLTVHNVHAGGFDRRAAVSVLDDPATAARAVEHIFRAVREGGFAGVNLDLEYLPPDRRAAYTAFVQQVAARLRPAGLLVTVAVPAKTADAPDNGWSGAFDYPALAAAADYLVVMAYDEHWPGSDPGPIASAGWVEAVVRYAAAAVPPGKVLLGVAAYGYDWAADGRTAGLTAPAAAARAARYGVPLSWDPAAQVPFYRYRDAAGVLHTVYFENASSMAAKVDLAVRYRLAGIAIWRLGAEDPACWLGVIRGKLRP